MNEWYYTLLDITGYLILQLTLPCCGSWPCWETCWQPPCRKSFPYPSRVSWFYQLD